MKTKVAFLFLALASCNTVSPEDCRVNPTGGAGGSGTLPIGAGVGATSGGDGADPPREPLDADGDTANPCVQSSPPTPRRGDCIVRWTEGSAECAASGGGDCYGHYVTGDLYTDINQANAECRSQAGSVKSCACVWMAPEAAALWGWYLCTGRIDCVRKQPPDNLDGTCQYDKFKVPATSEKEALSNAMLKCGHDVRKKYGSPSDEWHCSSLDLKCAAAN